MAEARCSLDGHLESEVGGFAEHIQALRALNHLPVPLPAGKAPAPISAESEDVGHQAALEEPCEVEQPRTS